MLSYFQHLGTFPHYSAFCVCVDNDNSFHNWKIDYRKNCHIGLINSVMQLYFL